MSLRKRVLYFVSSSTKTEFGQCRQHEETSTPPLSFWRVGGGARKEPAGRAGQGRADCIHGATGVTKGQRAFLFGFIF